MALFKRKGWRSRKGGVFAGKRRKGGSVVSGGLPTIGSTPISFGQLGTMGKGRRRKKASFGSGSFGLGSYGLSGGRSLSLGLAPSSGGFSFRPARRWPKFAALAALACALVLAVWVVDPVSLIKGSSPEEEPVAVNIDSTLRKEALLGASETVDENGIVHGTTADGVSYVVYGRDQESAELGKVSFLAVGDQVGSEQALALADSYAGETGDGSYDFWPFYQEIEPIVQSFDVSYINQETVMAGTEKFGYSGYPTFNTPDAAADAIDAVGFDIAGFGSNHVYDLGEYGAAQTHQVWNQHPELMVVGSYESQDERNAVHLIERGGASIAMLQYCYGDNYLGAYENFPNTYNLVGFDKDAMRSDVERAKTVANAVVVCMHWGTEYEAEPNAQQIEYAKFLADLDVDLVLGTHAHITQPIQYVTGDSGNTVPVVYGMSDIVSGWDKIDTIMSGLFTCDFTFEGGEAKVSNLAWHPCIEWSDGGDTRVRLLADMDDATINANVRVGNCDDDALYIKQFYESLPMDVPVVWEPGYAQALAGNTEFSVADALMRVPDRASILAARKFS